jgi:hypothetical protein
MGEARNGHWHFSANIRNNEATNQSLRRARNYRIPSLSRFVAFLCLSQPRMKLRRLSLIPRSHHCRHTVRSLDSDQGHRKITRTK